MGLKALAAAAQKEREEQSGRGAKAGGGLAALHRAAESERDVTALPVFQSNVTPLPSFQTALVQAAGGRSGLKTGVNRGALTQEAHRSATAGKGDVRARALERASSTPVWDVEPTPAAQDGGAWDVTPDFTAGRSGAGTPEHGSFAWGLDYGTERAAAALLGAGENITDLIGAGFYKGLQGITSLGGLAKNPVSEWAGRGADAFLDNSVTRDYEESIRERYQPSQTDETITGLGQTVVQMLPAIATGSVAARVLGTGLKAGQAANAGANVSRAVFGLQAAGGGANEARQEGADVGRALAYGAASGLLETTIESIAGGIPGMGEGKLRGIAEAVKASPIVSRVLDIAGEGGEEALSAILSPYLKRAMYDPDAENATAEEIAQSAILGAAAAGVLQVGLELPGAVSDVRSARAEVGSGADILSRVNQRLAQPGQVAADFQGLPEFASRFETLPSFHAQSGVDRAGLGPYDGENETGGLHYGRGEEGLELRGVYGENVWGDGAPEETHTRGMGDILEAVERTAQPKAAEWARGHLIERPSAPAARAAENARQYGTEVSVVEDSAIKAQRPGAWALTEGGRVYISDEVPAELADVVGYHEVVHAVKQRGAPLYDRILSQSVQQIDLNSEQAKFVLDTILGRRYPGKELFDLTPQEADTLYDELNAVVWGFYKADAENARAQFAGVFRDYEGYIASLEEALEGTKVRSEPTDLSSGQGAGPKQLPTAGPENAVGAARYGFDPYSHLLGRYGAIEPGETPARVVDVPRQTTERDRVSLTARTVMEAAATPEEFVPEIAEQLVNGSFSYLPISNQKRADRAAARIQRTGYADALANWSGQVRSGKTSADLVATGAQLYNAAVNAGDTARAMEILHDYIQAIRSGAQATQAARILKTLTPSGQLYMLQKEVNSLNDSLGERTLKKLRRGGEEKGIVLDEALADAFLNAPDESAQEAAYDRLIQSVADQIPPTFADKWNAWRYMAMLANPRTHIRNIVGNVGFQPVRWTKDRLAAAIEAGVSAASGGQLQRTKSFVAAPELYRAAWNDWANVKDTLSGSKYDDLKSEINSRRRVFQAAPLEAVRKGNSNLLELEDAIFKRVTYTDALAGFLQANGVSAEQLRSGQADSAVLERARAYAGREALRATYQDRNAVSDAVVRGVRALGPFGEAVLPFKRTPANILVRGAEYSPLGLAKALTYDLRQVQQGKMTGADAIDNIAAGLTGTGLMALGAALFSLGLVTGGGGGDEKQAALDQLTGGQNYALNLPDGTSVTLDWLAPEALPFFMGVELMDALGENGASSDDIFNAISSVSEPMLQMSMLQSLNDLIDSVSYVDSAGKLQALAASAVVSYFSQAIPTIGGQIERTAEGRRMSTYTDKSLPLPTDVQYALGRASARIPGWDYQQVPFIDAWGREEVSDPQPLRTFNNFLNPAYTSTRNVTAADEEVQRLYDATGDGGVIPERPRRYIIVDGVRKDLTGEEYVEYATLRGQTAYGLMEDLLDSRSYHSMSDEEKAGAVELVYSYADALSKAAVSDYRPEDWVTEAGAAQRTLGLSTADYLVLRKRYGAALSGDKVREAYRQGMEAEEYLEYAAGAKGYNEEARRPRACRSVTTRTKRAT